ncbi:hypothetical protein [Natronoglomus mannanivorans]|uniref:Uncharacterized protein n=1 Tax=Natronoglomus mannanivorans TaxID=2979990 RepID=A0AAP2Z3H9_9EURY|nr:hypothetical protein [Halobacteria archaeon AArc-xg1-1]
MNDETPDDGSETDETDCEPSAEEIIAEAERAINEDDTIRERRVPVDPSSGDLSPKAFHRQDWLLIAEAIVKVTRSYYTFSNFLEDRVEYARGLLPAIVAEAGVLGEDIRKHTDYRWDGSEPAAPEDRRPDHEPADIRSLFTVEPAEVDRTVDSFDDLDWIVVAEVLSAWRADLHLGGPSDVTRGGERDIDLKNAAVRAAGYEEVDDVLPIARTLYSESDES